MPAASRAPSPEGGGAGPSPFPRELPDALHAAAIRRSFGENVLVFRNGSRAHAVFYVESGRVRLVRFGAKGEEVVLHEARPGEFFAEASLDSARYHCDAVTTEPSVLLQVPAAALLGLLASDPEFTRKWVSVLARQLRSSRARLERLSLKGARQRVLHFLLSEGRGPASEVVLDGTLKELARDLGLSHEVLYRTLAAMQRERIIERDQGALRLRR